MKSPCARSTSHLTVRFCALVSLAAGVLLAAGCSDESEPEEVIPEEACSALVATCHSDKWVADTPGDICHTLGHVGDETGCRSRYTECTKICMDGKAEFGEDGHGGGSHGGHGGTAHEGHGDGGKGGADHEGHGDGGKGGTDHEGHGEGGEGHGGADGEGHGGESHGGESHGGAGGEGHGGEGHGGGGHGGEGHGGEGSEDSKCAVIAETCAKLASEEAEIKTCVSLGEAKDEAACDAGFADCRTTCGAKLCTDLGNVCHGGEGKSAECHDLGHDGPPEMCFDGALDCYAACEE